MLPGAYVHAAAVQHVERLPAVAWHSNIIIPPHARWELFCSWLLRPSGGLPGWRGMLLRLSLQVSLSITALDLLTLACQCCSWLKPPSLSRPLCA